MKKQLELEDVNNNTFYKEVLLFLTQVVQCVQLKEAVIEIMMLKEIGNFTENINIKIKMNKKSDIEIKPLDIIDTNICYICGAKEKRNGNSFHCWDIEYECGCRILGAISDNDIYLDTPCPKN